MLISTKGRYALRVMLELAAHEKEEFIPLKVITEKQNISKKYLESIMVLLSKADFVDAVHGKGGGYKLSREPKKYKIGDILRLTEGTLAPVMCLEKDAPVCERADVCKTLPLWTGLNDVITEYLDGITLEDVLRGSEKL